MDEGAAAITEDGGEGRPHGEDDTHQNYRQAKGTDGRVGVHCSQDYGEAFREEAPDLEHQQHQKKHTLIDDHSDTTTDAEAGVTDQLPQCQTERKDGENFSQEANAETGGEITKRHAFECSHCGKSYGMIGHFLNHQRKHTKAPKSLSQDLEDLKKKSFQCEFCGRNYSRASALEAHLRCHEEKLVKPRNRDLEESPVTEETVIDSKPNKNQTLDIPDKPFTCACGKAFTAQMGLKTHQRFSRNSRCSPEDLAEKTKKPVSEFNCSECKKTFSSNIAFLNHQRWHANRSMNSSKRIPCEECGKVFMTLTFYHRHQRLVHSSETPAKSFLHQVCQLQKKAFECKECGLKFSRASALHSHELHHTDIFKETKKVAPPRSVSLNQQKSWESSAKDGEQEKAPPVHPVSTAEDVDADDTDGEECYGPGDFNVQVISASESEDEATQHANPDLELLCESDREAQDDDVVSPSAGVSKPKMDLKIVQIDLNTADAEDVAVAKETEVKKAEERFDCPDCSLWFSSAASLRIHRMWHDVRKRRQQTQGQSVTVYTHDTWGHDASSCAAHCSDIEKHENASTDHQALNQAEELGKKLTCNECGKCFSRLSALVSHQLHHPKRKEFQCPDCMTSYSHAATLFNHMKHCSSQKKENHLLNKRQYNPTKTLLGPKMFHCEQCGKAFWSLGAYSHHKQNQTQCADFRLRKGLPPVNGYPRCSAKVACPVCGRTFRHKGIMALHMRKHENGDHRCDICGRSFRLFSSLLRHQVVHSSQLLPPPVKSFQYQVEQLKKNTYSCPDCGKLFSRAKALQFHMKSHGYESGYSPSSLGSPVTPEDLQCATCLAHFNSKASLRAHQKLCIKKDVRIGHAVREEIVDVGAKETVAHAELNEKGGEGIKIETQTEAGGLENLCAAQFKYKCQSCDEGFSAVEALNFHKRIHSEGRNPAEKADVSGLDRSNPHCPDTSDPDPEAVSDPVINRYALSESQNSHNFVVSVVDSAGNPVDGQPVVDRGPGQGVGFGGSTPAPLKTKLYQCPLCSMAFAKPRGLRAHKWQAHSRKTKGSSKAPLLAKKESVVSVADATNTADSEAESDITALKNSSDDGGKKTGSAPLPVQKEAAAQPCAPAGAVADQKTAFSDLKQDCKMEIRTPETTAEVSAPQGFLLGPSPRYFFRCNMCGKAFPTEEQLRNHKSKAKTRPYSCALCCQGFWTESQLNQHFIWHDEVRRRLPHEVRYRFSAAATPKTIRPSTPSADRGGKPLSFSSELNQDSQSESSHKCQHCGKSFLSPAALEIHQSQYCNKDLYHCSICPRTFREIQELISHHQECLANFEIVE